MRLSSLTLFIIFMIMLLVPLGGAQAQDVPSVQELHGSLAPGQIDVFRIAGLEQEQILTAFAENTSGNLDPALIILPPDQNLSTTYESFKKDVAELVSSSPYPLLDLPALWDQYFLAWDDDSGPGHSAALEFTIPSDGDYFLIVASSLSAAGRSTAGDYRLLVGLDAPQVLAGTARPTGAVIAVQDQAVLESQLVQEFNGSLSTEKPAISIKLSDFNPGDMLYVNLQAMSGDLKPILLLRDFSDKPIQVANLNGQASSASFEQAFPEGGANYTLDIYAAETNGQITSGDFKLQVGINAPEALEGKGQANSESLLKLAIPVKVGFKLQQIINIDQPNEIMNDVGTLRLEWTDPALAFNPDDCNCSYKLYTENSFTKFLEDVQGKWPDFTFFNQQGNRWTQNRLIYVEANGHIIYLERFSTDFQVDFDWTAFPFDTQDFYIKVDMLFPEDEYVFAQMEDFNEIDPNNGEDEFILTDFDTQISTEVSSTKLPVSRFTFHFSAPRHLDYYIFRIFVPILLIIVVSYITFFLKDYSRRIEIATGNLLLFIAFSWSLGDNYPRMGYLTFVDAIMAITFIINTLVVVLNVYFKYLEQKGEREKADRLEAPFNYIYPIAYLVSFGVVALMFLR
jgi:Neurotransmitter-gated ion-channel ligand binding domain